MRTSVRITTGLSATALTFALTACGGGSSAAGNPASTKQPATSAAPTTPTAPKTDGTIPEKAMCAVISKDVVEQAIGKKVYSASNADILSGTTQPTLCDYYVDTDEVSSVEIKWATPEQDLWEDSYKNLGTSTGGESVRTRVSGLGNGAYKEVGTIAGVKVIGYTALLKRGIVLSVYDNSGLPDSAVFDATKAAIAVIDKL